jgi:hypothetical protein
MYSVFDFTKKPTTRWYRASAVAYGVVFVSEYDLEEYFEDKRPELKEKAEADDVSILDLVEYADLEEAFQKLAYDKMWEKFGESDDPMKLRDVEIDMKTFK